MLRLYNTLSRKKEIFKALKDKRVNIFVCGPTVYDLSHIGHARTYIVFDTFVRYLRFLGYKVFYLENITDVDDKIIQRAKESAKTPKQIARHFETEFRKDMRSLGIRSVTRYARASDFIPEIIKQVERLIAGGWAYQAGGDVYFRVKKFKDYGKLSGQKLDELKSFEPHTEQKENILDFALWKASKPGEPKWQSPWGWGRPGWHIEDTAISEKFFGPQYDIHGGGIDLIFPHHECEIAQQEASSGRVPFVRYWLHTGFLLVRGEKMSKSLGNFITIQDLLKKISPEILRLLVSQTHYRSPIDFTDRLLEQARAASDRLNEFAFKVKHSLRSAGRLTGRSVDMEWIERRLAKAKKDFFGSLNDDFNTPMALANLFDFIKDINPRLDRGLISKKYLRSISDFLKDIDAIFGILKKDGATALPKHVQALIQERERFRSLKLWHKADAIRVKLEKAGYVLEDTAAGVRVKKR